jgi:hypothetical protein
MFSTYINVHSYHKTLETKILIQIFSGKSSDIHKYLNWDTVANHRNFLRLYIHNQPPLICAGCVVRTYSGN